MAESQYLNEERYQKNKKMLMCIATAIVVGGLLIGGGLIAGGIIKKGNAQQIDDSMPRYSGTTSFNDTLNGSADWMDRVSMKNDEDFAASGMIGGGIFIVFASVAFSLPIFLLAKRREIMAFQMQQMAPVVKEGIEKAAPVVGKATGEMAKAAAAGVSEAAGSVAKEVAKGIKEGIKEDTDKR